MTSEREWKSIKGSTQNAKDQDLNISSSLDWIAFGFESLGEMYNSLNIIQLFPMFIGMRRTVETLGSEADVD